MDKFTPGPWSLVCFERGDHRIFKHTDTNDVPIAEMTPCPDGENSDLEIHANACLIAASPEMYHLIKRLISAAIHMQKNHCCCHGGTSEDFECQNCQDVKAIAELIEKVEGK